MVAWRNLERLSRALWAGGHGIVGFERAFYAKVMMPRLASVPAPPLPEMDIDVVSLVCAEAVDMAIWSARSLDYWSGYRWRQVWIDDGSLTPALMKRALAALPRLRIVTHAEGQDVLAGTLANFPACRRAAAEHPIFRRAFLVAEVMRGDRCMCLDTDVLFFAEPREILAWAEAPVAETRFLYDPITFYFPSLETLSRWCGLNVLDHVNGGLGLMPAGWHDLDLTEWFLRKAWDLPGRTWHIEQSILAIQMTQLAATSLSLEHEVSFHPQRRPYCVARHYVSAGPVRDYFFTEGIALLGRFLLANSSPETSTQTRRVKGSAISAAAI